MNNPGSLVVVLVFPSVFLHVEKFPLSYLGYTSNDHLFYSTFVLEGVM